jgi:hypothetical protein
MTCITDRIQQIMLKKRLSRSRVEETRSHDKDDSTKESKREKYFEKDLERDRKIVSRGIW